MNSRNAGGGGSGGGGDGGGRRRCGRQREGNITPDPAEAACGARTRALLQTCSRPEAPPAAQQNSVATLVGVPQHSGGGGGGGSQMQRGTVHTATALLRLQAISQALQQQHCLLRCCRPRTLHMHSSPDLHVRARRTPAGCGWRLQCSTKPIPSARQEVRRPAPSSARPAAVALPRSSTACALQF